MAVLIDSPMSLITIINQEMSKRKKKDPVSPNRAKTTADINKPICGTPHKSLKEPFASTNKNSAFIYSRCKPVCCYLVKRGNLYRAFFHIVTVTMSVKLQK